MSSYERNTETEGCTSWCHKRCGHWEDDPVGSSQGRIDQEPEDSEEREIMEKENQQLESGRKAKKVVIHRALQGKKARTSHLEVQNRRGAKGTEKSDATVAELNQRLQEEKAKVSKMEEAARQQKQEAKEQVAELSQRLQKETETSAEFRQHLRKETEASAELRQHLWKETEASTGLRQHLRKETETSTELRQHLRKETEASAELRQHLWGETEAYQRKEKHLEATVAELTENSRRNKRDIEQLKAQNAETERRLYEQTIKLSRLEEVSRQSSRKEGERKRLETKVAELELRLQEKTVKLSNIETFRRNSRKGESSEQLEQKIVELEVKLSDVEDDARQWEQKSCDLLAEIQKHRDEINQLKARVKTLDEQANKPPLQVLVRKPDSISMVEVEELVKALNAQIEQLASRITDSFRYLKLSGSSAGSAALNDLRDYLGPWLLDALRRGSNNPELIRQIALQTILIHACGRIVSHWNPPFWNNGSIFFRVFSNKGGGDGISAGTWSAMAPTMSQSEVQDANVKYLSGILVKAIAAVGGPLPGGETLPPEHQEDVENVARRALEFRQIVDKEVKSMDLVIFTVPSDTQFNPSQMIDTEGSTDATGCDRVICTLEMGLQYRKRAELGKPGGGQCGVTLKPKVVLPAAFA